MELVRVLESKNRCLKRFLKDSEAFLLSAEKGDFSRLELFESKRNSALKAMSLYDERISALVTLLPPSEKTPVLIESVRSCDHIKEQLVSLILSVDEKIIQLIENERNRILKELSAAEKNTQIMKKFKSKWIPESGEKLDGKL